MIDKLKAYGAIIAAAILGVLLVAQTVRLHKTQLELANHKAKTAQTLQHIADLTAKAYQAVLAREAQWSADQERNARETAAKIQTAETAAAESRAAAGRLQQRVAALVAQSRARSQSAGPAPAVAGVAGEDAIGVLAGVFNRIDDTAGELAAYADRLRIAGEACERDYDALRQPATVKSP